MNTTKTDRFALLASLCLFALPLAGCGGGDDDDKATTGTWSGKTYLLSIPKANWTEPRTIGTDIDGFVPSFIMKVEGESMTVGVAGAHDTPDAAVQDLCSPTFTIDFSAAAYPKVDLGPTSMRVHILNVAENPGEDNVQETSDVYGLEMHDVLPNGSTPSTKGTFTATMDFSQIYPLFTALGSEVSRDGVCTELGKRYGEYGGYCAPCPTAGKEPYCLTIKGEQLGALEAPNLELQTVDEAPRPESCNIEKYQSP